MVEWVIWFVLAFLLLIAEIFTPGFLLACFAVGCLFSGVAALLGAGLLLQLSVFAIITLIVFFTIRPMAMKHFHKNSESIKTNVDAVLDQEGIVIETIDGLAGTGRVKVGGEDWRADAIDDSTIDAGTKVKIVSIEGITLKVQREQSEGD